MTTVSKPQKLVVTATTTGISNEIVLPFGKHVLYFHAASWGSASLKLAEGKSPDVRYYNVTDGSREPIVITGNEAIPVLGGQRYVLDVTAITAPITLLAKQAELT